MYQLILKLSRDVKMLRMKMTQRYKTLQKNQRRNRA